MTIDFSKLRQAAHDARELSNRLARNDTSGSCNELRHGAKCLVPCSEPHHGDRCLVREESRLKGYPELPPNSTRRGFQFYNPERLCRACRPYWFAEMAALSLEETVKGERLIAHHEGREQEVAIDVAKLRELVPDQWIEALIDPEKFSDTIIQSAHKIAGALRAQHHAQREHHAAAVALLDEVVRR